MMACTGYGPSTATSQTASYNDTSCVLSYVSEIRTAFVADLRRFVCERMEALERSKRGWRGLRVRASSQVSDRRIALAPLPRSAC